MSEKLHLVHDILDKLVLDRDKHRLGRVDEVVLQIADGEQPRVVYIEMGGEALARRLGRIGDWIAARLAASPRGKTIRQAYRLAWSLVRQIGPAHVVLDVECESSRALAWERWLARHVVPKLGG